MANSTINQLPSAESFDSTDLIPIWKTGTGATMQVSSDTAFKGKANSTSFANPFSSETNYSVGDYVVYNDLFYRCTTAHSAGEWNSNHFTLTNVSTGFGVINNNIATETLALLNTVLDAKGGVIAPTPRFLRFNPSNKKALIIKSGTMIKVGTHIFSAESDVSFTLSNLSAGTDYFVSLCYSGGTWTLEATTEKQTDTDVKRYIGRFHTLCVAVAANTTMIISAPLSSVNVGTKYLVKPYRQDTDPDFYNFYNKTVSAVEAGAKAEGIVQGPFYDILTVPHTLAGFSAGDILPESVWCLTWKPDTLVEDAMVYDVSTGIAVDIYLQSGTGRNTRSKYNATHTVNRPQICHSDDMLQVGKQLLSDDEFTSAALGSNECTNIQDSSDKTYVGGHVDTAGRRMTSAIGCEECCGYLWQWLRNVSALGTGSAWTNIDKADGHDIGSSTAAWYSVDGQNKFGQMYQVVTSLLAGGLWLNGVGCGSRFRYAFSVRSFCGWAFGSRGSSQVIRNMR